MLKQKNALPGAKLHFPINNRHHLARSRQDHANVRRHVIAAFRTVSEVISLFWHQSIEKFFHVMSRARIGIFHNDHAATGVLNKDRDGPAAQTAFVDLSPDIIGDFICSFAIAANFKLLVVDTHKVCGCENNTEQK